MPRRKQKIKYARKLACKHLNAKGDISNSLQPLCFCTERELVLAPRAYVCQVCNLYDPTANLKISQIYEESKNIAEEKIKEEKLEIEKIRLEEIEGEEDIDLSIDEFEEEEEEIPLKFEKRKAGKDLEEGGNLELECPFCGELFDDLASHIQQCEFAPDDASINDIVPSRPKKKKHKPAKEIPKKAAPGEKEEDVGDEDKEKKTCPYCGKEFIRLGRHVNSCSKRPANAE